MKKTSHNTAALFAVAAFIIMQTVFFAGGSGAMTTTPQSINLSSEKQTLESFDDALAALEKNVKDLGKKASITSQELNSAKSTASNVKSRVSQAQQAFQSVINKLKAAGKLDDPDSVLPQITHPKAQSIIRENGGTKRILESLASQLSGLSQEVDSLIQPLNSKVRADAGERFVDGKDLKARAVRVAYDPAPIARGVKCLLRGGIYRLNPSNHNFDMLLCACNPDDPVSQSSCPGGANHTPR